MFPLVVVPLVLVAAGVLAANLATRDRERSAVWQRWVHARNWEHLSSWPSMVNAHQGGPFGKGGRRRADRGFIGTFDRLPVFGFRYRYTVSSGKSSQTYSFLVCGVRFPGAAFPPLRILHESGIIFGRDKDLQFENVQFNEYWHVKSPSPRFAHDVLHPRTMEYLMGPLPRFGELWFDRDVMFAVIPGDPAPGMVDALLRTLTGFSALLRPHLLREVGTAARDVDSSGPGVSLAEQERRMAQLAEMAQQPGTSR